MFKVTKILNSGSNVPEPCRMYTTAGVAYKIGTALTLTAGKLTNATEDDIPLYIAGENAAADQKSTLVCYPILPNMIFETTLYGSPSTAKCGTKVLLSCSDEFADMVTPNGDEGVATIVDVRGVKKSGDKIYVRFI